MKVRLDQLLYECNLASSLETARAMIGAGQVYVNEHLVDKSGSLHSRSVNLRLKSRCPYVSRGGHKLEAGLIHFQIDPGNLICLDVGASTGGFTDCLLQRKAQRVFAVDVAYGQLSWQIRQNPRVVVLERFNARNISIESIHNEFIDLAVMDASFISITTLLPPLTRLFKNEVKILALIKPQFELSRKEVGPGGVVTDPVLHQRAIDKILHFVCQQGLVTLGVSLRHF